MHAQSYISYREGFAKITETLYAEKDELTLAEIKERMCIDSGTASMLIHCLEQWGMVKFQPAGYKIVYRSLLTIKR
jgi:DNA-binding MarR family transcriptional regulator